MKDRIVGIAEAARRLGMHPKTLQTKCKNGQCPIAAVLTTSGWQFRDSDIDVYIEQLFSGSPQEPSRPVEAGGQGVAR